MIINFTYKENKYSHSLRNNIIKIYSVPKEYSDDELYIADYSSNGLEPIPASNGLETELIYHGVHRISMNQEWMDVKCDKLEEVSYA